jgi:hypothetical protein
VVKPTWEQVEDEVMIHKMAARISSTYEVEIVAMAEHARGLDDAGVRLL